MPRKSKKQREEDEQHQAVYDGVVFQSGSVVDCGEDFGVLEVATNDGEFAVIINSSNAEFLIKQLDDFIKGRAPHMLRDDN